MSEPLARVSFVPTLDERTDVALRLAEGFPSLRKRNRVAIAVTAAVAAVISAVGVFFVLRLFNEEVPAGRLQFVAALVALIVAWRLPPQLRHEHRRRMRKAIADVYGADLPFAVELHGDRVVADTSRVSISVRWQEVLGVHRTGDDIEIRGAEALIVVRARAFATPAAAATFLDVAERLRAAAARDGR